MAIRVAHSRDLLTRFHSWFPQVIPHPLVPYVSEDPAMQVGLEGDIEQRALFIDDFKRNIYDLSNSSIRDEVVSLMRSVAMIVVSPFALIGEIYRCVRGLINKLSCFLNIVEIPFHISRSIVTANEHLVKSIHKVVCGASIGIGFLAWHGGERVVRLFTHAPFTVLSTDHSLRQIVYDSLGITLLAAFALSIPVAAVQIAALPILLGSISGTINNYFIVRDCPEFYTFGHYYDGAALRGHLVKTNNLLIKPIVTGCYKTTWLTTWAGLYTWMELMVGYLAGEMIPVSVAAAMIAGVFVISLIAAHIFSVHRKSVIQNNLDAYSRLTGIEWNEENSARSWDELREIRNNKIDQKREFLAADIQALQRFEEELEKLTAELEGFNGPVKYISAWTSSRVREGIFGMCAGGVGALALAVAPLFFRVVGL